MKTLPFVCVCLLSFSTMCTNAQPSKSLTPSRYAFHLSRLLLKDGTARTGWFLGTQDDSVVIQAGEKSERISRHDLLRITIDTEPQKSKVALVGMFAGMYIGNILAFKAKNQPELFLRGREQAGGIVLANVLFAFAGGEMGYFLASAGSDETIFDFTGGEEKNAAHWATLVEVKPHARRQGSIHLSFQAASVSGPIPSADGANPFFWGEPASAWNMMRKLQLTYSITDFLDVGLASVWLGQPSFTRYRPYPDFTYTSVDMSGRGYYVVGTIQPLWQLGWRDVQWDIGAGVGTASMEFTAGSPLYPYASSLSNPAVAISKTSFSALAYTELKVFLTDHLSLGLTAELAYVPEHVPDVQGITFESTTLGTSSVGVVFGFHL